MGKELTFKKQKNFSFARCKNSRDLFHNKVNILNSTEPYT